MIDFQILEVSIANDLVRPVTFGSVHRAVVRSLHTQELITLDDRWGSWNTPPDQDGRFKNAPSSLAAVLQERVASGAVEKRNPFVASSQPARDNGNAPNPFLAVRKQDSRAT